MVKNKKSKNTSKSKVQKVDKKKMIFVFAAIIGIALLGSSYAWYQVTKNSTHSYNMTSAGPLDVDYSDSNGEIELLNIFPIADTDAESQEGYNVVIKNNSGMALSYTIYLDDVALETGQTRLSDEFIKVNITNNNTFSPRFLNIVNSVTNNGLKERTLLTNTIANNATVTYNIKVWLASNATSSEMNKVFLSRIRVVSSQIAD